MVWAWVLTISRIQNCFQEELLELGISSVGTGLAWRACSTSLQSELPEGEGSWVWSSRVIYDHPAWLAVRDYDASFKGSPSGLCSLFSLLMPV